MSVEHFTSWVATNLPGFLTRLGVAVLILATAWIVGSLFGRWLGRLLHRRGGRGGTLGSIVADTTKLAFLVVGMIMALDQLGLEIATLLAGAGILGLAVGFGAQALVKDVISGFFLLLDGALEEGDIVELSSVRGTVEHVGLRTSRIRTFDGTVWYVQNGEIRAVGNYSRDWARAIVEVGLAYEQDASEGLRVLGEVGRTYATEHQDTVLEPPEAQGLLGLGDSAVTVRLVVKVQASERYPAERELRKRVKAALDAARIEIPFPRSVVYHRMDNDGAANGNTGKNGDGKLGAATPKQEHAAF